MSAMLEVRGLEVNYGHIEAVRGIDLDLEAKEITALVGANGAGKSTTLLALSGLLPKARGKILFEGEDVTNLAPHQLVARGIVQVPEGRAILTTMTVLENLELGAYRRGLKNVDSDLEYVFNLFPRLKERITGIAGNLSGGEQQMLAIGRALCQAAPATAGRAVDGPGADRGAGNLPLAAGDQRRRPDPVPGGAERAPGAQDRPARLRA